MIESNFFSTFGAIICLKADLPLKTNTRADSLVIFPIDPKNENLKSLEEGIDWITTKITYDDWECEFFS